VELPTASWTTRPWRLALALSWALIGLIGIAVLASASPAQAHEPWGAKAWGKNQSGQLGDGTTEGPEKCETRACSTSPVAVIGLTGVIALAAGEEHALGLREDGAVVAWGNNVFGQLGNGTTEGSDLPIAVSGLKGVKAIAAGGSDSLALLQDGRVMAWGANSEGQLGDGTTESRSTPVAVCAVAAKGPCSEESHQLKEVVAIAAGSVHSVALLSNGTVVAWGRNSAGQLGDGTSEGRHVPVPVCALGGKGPCPEESQQLKEVIAISAGGEHNLALLSKEGTVVAWGRNFAGGLGNGSETNSDVPVPVSGLVGAIAVSAGEFHNLALLKDGALEAWGYNNFGQLGDGTSSGPEHCGVLMNLACAKTPVAVSGATGVVAASAVTSHSLALATDGTVKTWGANTNGQLGVGTSLGPEPCPPEPGSCSTKPLQASNLVDIKGIAGGGQESLAFGPTPPIVTAISPNQPRKKGNTRVTITGSEFEEATEVKFGATKATSVAVKQNGTIIEAVAPAGKGTVDVTVTTPAGTSASSAADRFYYSKPAVKKVSPKKGSELGGTTVTISGTNLSGVTAVKFGSTNATSFKVNSQTSLTAVSPAHAAGKVDVTVSGPNGTSAVSGKDRFTYK
jgi:alpha-tubulin suppressor-like RCC1 family protein